MKILTTMIIGLLFCSCTKSQNEDNSPPFPEDNSIEVSFIDDKGNDASDIIPMKLIRTDSSNPVNVADIFEMVNENYSYKCYIDGKEIPLTYQFDDDDNKHVFHSIVELQIYKPKSAKIKNFVFCLISLYGIYNDIWSDHLYEFEYRFKLPSLFGDKENSLKVFVKAKNLVKKKFERTLFNGVEISATNGTHFDILVTNQ